MKRLFALALPLALLALADAAHAQTTPVGATTERSTRRNRDRIEQEEVVKSGAQTAFDLVQSARPMWLNRHRPSMRSAVAGNTSNDLDPRASAGDSGNGDDLIVLLDGTYMGHREALRDIAITQVWSVEYLSPTAVRLRFDRQTRDGAVVIYTNASNDAGARRTN